MDFERSFMLATKDAKRTIGTSFGDGRWILFVYVQKFEARSRFWRTFDCARYEAVETCCPLSRNEYLKRERVSDCFYCDLVIRFQFWHAIAALNTDQADASTTLLRIFNVHINQFIVYSKVACAGLAEPFATALDVQFRAEICVSE